jgi:signal transduction histidine kinase
VNADRWVRRAAAATGLVLAAGGAVTVLTPGFDPAITTAARTDGAIAWLVLVVALLLVGAGVAAWFARPGSGLSLLAFWTAAAWLAPDLAGSRSVGPAARTLGLVLAPMLIPLVVHLPVRALRADRGPRAIALIALYLVTSLAALGYALTWDPFLVVECMPVCTRGDNLLGIAPDIPAALEFRRAGWWLAGLGGVWVAAWATWTLVRGRGTGRADRAVLVPAIGVALAMMGYAATRLLEARPAATDPWSVRTMVVLAVALGVLAAGIAWHRVGEGRRAAGVRRLVELLEAAAGSGTLGGTLSAVLHDPTVRVAYPLPDGRGFVDEQGRPVAAPTESATRSVTPIERAGTVIALVEHDRDLDRDLLAREVGPAARLAVDNERLGALLQAQMRELQASRERIVETGDTARRQLERDLHDGAQQRLLAVSYELRLAQAAGDVARPGLRAALDEAAMEIDRALAELRELAHGIWPAVLAEAGLEAALVSLAEDTPVPLTLEVLPDERFPAAVEAAAYLAVTEAVRRAAAAAATGIAVHAARLAGSLHLDIRVIGPTAGGRWLRVEDRVGAAGGEARVTADPSSGTVLAVELPCA